MSSQLEIMLHGVNFVRNSIRLFNSTSDLLQDERLSNSTKIFAVVTRAIGMGFSAYETGAIINHASAEHMMNVKEVEVIEKICEAMARAGICISKGTNGKYSTNEQYSSLEQELIPGVVDIMRVATEMHMYDEKHYLEMSPEERASHTRTVNVFEGSGMNMHFLRIDEKPIDVEECIRELENYEAIDTALTAGNLLLENKQFSPAVEFVAEQVNSIMRDGLQPNGRPLGQQVELPVLEQHVFVHQPPVVRTIIPGLAERRRQRDNQDPNDLLSLSYIPSNLYEDDPHSIFRRCECRISQAPARFPVKDPTANGVTIIYDHINILEWLQKSHEEGNPLLSPQTRLPLQPEDLIPMTAAQRIIDSKLRTFQERWVKILDDNPDLKGLPNTPDAQEIIAAARAELGAEYFDNPDV